MVDQEGGQEAVVAFVVKYSVTGPSNPPSVNLETRPSVETLPNRLHQECVTSLLLGATLDCHTDDLNMQLLMPCANHSRCSSTYARTQHSPICSHHRLVVLTLMYTSMSQ